MITAKQCAAAAAVTGHTLSWLHKRDFADSKIISCVCAGASDLQACTFLPDTVSGEVLKNSIQDDIAQDQHLQLAA